MGEGVCAYLTWAQSLSCIPSFPRWLFLRRLNPWTLVVDCITETWREGRRESGEAEAVAACSNETLVSRSGRSWWMDQKCEHLPKSDSYSWDSSVTMSGKWARRGLWVSKVLLQCSRNVDLRCKIKKWWHLLRDRNFGNRSSEGELQLLWGLSWKKRLSLT